MPCPLFQLKMKNEKLRIDIGCLRLKYPLFLKSFILTILFFSQVAFCSASADSIGVIEIYNQTGKVIGKEAGVFISQDELLTHYYVFSGVERAVLKVGDAEFAIKGVCGRNSEEKLLKLKVGGDGFKKADFANAIKENQEVFINLPDGETVKGGIVSIEDRIKIELDSKMPKLRGLPVFNKEGEVLGIIEFFVRNKDDVYAIPTLDGISFEDTGLLNIKEWREMRTKEWMESDVGKRQTIVQFIGTGRYEEALPKLEELIKDYPDDKEAYFKLGVCYGKLERYKESLDAYKKYNLLSPDDAKAYFNLGICCLALNKLNEAQEAFSKTVEIDKNHLNSHYNLGILYFDAGKKVEAEKEFEFLKKFNLIQAKTLSKRLREYFENER